MVTEEGWVPVLFEHRMPGFQDGSAELQIPPRHAGTGRLRRDDKGKGNLHMDEAIVPWNMTLTGEGKGVLQLAFKGHEMTFQITRISWEENEESSETGK